MEYFLREITANDMHEVNKWRNDREIVEGLGAPFRYINDDVDHSWYESYLQGRANNVRLAVVDSTSDNIIGIVSLTSINWLLRSGEFSIQIGNKLCQGQGAGKYASKSLLKHAFLDLGLNRVYLSVLAENTAAYNMYKSIGFVEEGVLRHAAYKNGCYKNMIYMSMLASEFKE